MGELLQFAPRRQQRSPVVRKITQANVTCSDPGLARSFDASLSASTPDENDAHALLALGGFGVRTVRVKDGFRRMTYARNVDGGVLSVDLYSDTSHNPISFDAHGQAAAEQGRIRFLAASDVSVAHALSASLTALENWLLQRDLVQAL